MAGLFIGGKGFSKRAKGLFIGAKGLFILEKGLFVGAKGSFMSSQTRALHAIEGNQTTCKGTGP